VNHLVVSLRLYMKQQ